jgi:hypothetical protein
MVSPPEAEFRAASNSDAEETRVAMSRTSFR